MVRLLREVVGSILAGALVGGVLTLYLRFVRRELVVFAVVVVFATAAAAQALHFELLLSLLVAGFLVENVAPVRAEPLVEMLHVMAVPGLRDLLRHGGGRSPASDLRGALAGRLAVALVRVGLVYAGSHGGGATGAGGAGR